MTITIKEVREKYPQYSLLTDRELADKLHSKFYPELSKKDFYNRIGMPSDSKGFKGVGEDIAKSAKELPKNLWEAVKQLPLNIAGGAYQLGTDPKRVSKNLLSGLAQGGAGTLNIPANIRDYLVNKDLASKESPSFRLPESILPREYDYAKGMGLESDKAGDIFWRGLGENAPYALLGEVGSLGTLPRMTARSGAQVPYAIGQNQDPITAAATPTMIEGLLRGGAGALNQARPAVMFRGTLPIEELEANLRAAEGTNTPLPNIIGSPSLKQIFENMSAKVPGGGGDQVLGRIGQQVENRANQLLEEVGGHLGPADRNAQLKTTLENAYEQQRTLKNRLYEPVNELAESEGFELNLPTFRQRATQQLNQIEESPLLIYDADFRNSYNRLVGIERGSQGAPSILETNMTADRLHNEGTRLVNRSDNATDRAIGNLYIDLANRARNDIRSEMQTRGSSQLTQAYNEATRNYRENYSQFLDKDVYKLTRPDIEAETIINDIIRPGKRGDKYSRIEKIQNVLPENQRNILGNAWLRNALDKEGTLNAKAFARLINDLGPRQFEALFPDPGYRQRLLDYGRLRGMNEKALSRLANPATGQSLATPAYIGAQATSATNALMAGNPLMFLGSVIGPQVGARALNYLMTSPEFRESMIQRMMQGQQGPRFGRAQLATSPLTASANQKPFMETENYDVY